MLKIAIVTNVPAPYRTPVFSTLSDRPGLDVSVIACVEREPNRMWDYSPLSCRHTFLRPRFVQFRQRYIHHNLDVLGVLRRERPDVVVTDGFNPTHLYAFLYARWHGLAHVSMTDGTLESERSLTWMHRWVRSLVYARSDAFIAASEGGQALLANYGIARQRRFASCLCVDNEAYRATAAALPEYDLLFCGRVEAVKNPHFVLELGIELAKRLRRQVRVLFVGSGSLEAQLKQAADLHPGLLRVDWAGFASQAALPALYRSARLFVFPTLWDPWGVVVNEACAAGLPVLTSPNAGAANELVRDGENGYVCALDVQQWADRAERLLTDADLRRAFAARSLAIVDGYTVAAAADGIEQACRFGWQRKAAEPAASALYHSRPRVVIVERQLLQYRVRFYTRLRQLLSAQGIELQLLVGEGTRAEKLKRNEAWLDWAIPIKTHYLLGERLCWQPYGSYARRADLVIVMHENKIIYNLWLLFGARPRRIAFWGHGANMQSDHPGGWKERFKRWTVNKADWWFAYTELSAGLIGAAGFPRERTTVVENAVDTDEMVSQCQAVTPQQVAKRRAELGLGEGPVGLYLGSLYKEKRLDFLLEAAEQIRRRLPGFQLLIVGAGSEQALIDAAVARHDWIRCLGPLQGEAKALALVMADVMLNPGLVGLGILDSFTSGRPMFTTNCGLHSPEISYLDPGRNGVMTDNDVSAFAEAVSATLEAPEQLERLRQGALQSASRYTVDNMASRICGGIGASLAIH